EFEQPANSRLDSSRTAAPEAMRIRCADRGVLQKRCALGLHGPSPPSPAAPAAASVSRSDAVGATLPFLWSPGVGRESVIDGPHDVPVAVVGSGGFGTCLAYLLARNGLE